MENSIEFKYIVYITINTINGKFYVGVHKTDTPYKFDGYLGCGAWLNTPSSYNKGKTPLHAAILKYGTHKFKRLTLFVFDKLELALSIEAKIVNKEFIKLSTNYNATIGGGMPPLLIKQVNQFDLEGNFIRKWDSEENIRRHFNSHASMSDIIKDKRNFAGYYWSHESSINIADYKRIVKYGYIELYDKDGNYITSYSSTNEASLKLDISFKKLNRAIFRMKLCEGYFFIKSGISIWDILNINEETKKQITPRKHPIYRYKESGECDKYYLSIVLAVRDTPHTSGSSIKNAVINGWLCGGYRWSLFKANNYFDLEKPKTYSPCPPIELYTKDGLLVKVWTNYKECKKEFPYCLDVCNKKIKSTKNYIFKYQSNDIV